jgi:hypothetical protein
MNSSRRTFLYSIFSAGTAAAVLGLPAQAQAEQSLLSETEPSAQALGYKTDVSRVDKVKYPKYVAGQDCANCSFYQGKETDATAPCPMFGKKLVEAKGWCTAYVKKA